MDDGPVLDKLMREAQEIADDVHRFSNMELSVLAQAYRIDETGLNWGDIRSVVGTARAKHLRPQARPVTPCTSEEWFERVGELEAKNTILRDENERLAEMARMVLADADAYFRRIQHVPEKGCPWFSATPLRAYLVHRALGSESPERITED